MSRQKEIIDIINTGHANLSEIQDALRNGELTETELEINCGFDAQLINRVKRFNSYSFYCSSVHDLPRLKNDAKDVYFIGMPNSGKTTILSSLLTYVNRIGKLKINTSNDLGIEYIDNLIELGENGYCPISNYGDILIGCPILFGNYSKKNRFHSLNIIDIPGEALEKLYFPVTESFDMPYDHFYKNYFSNKNGKILIFTIDYFSDFKKTIDASIKLQLALQILLLRFNFKPLIEAIYFVVTKSDLFPVNKEINPSLAEEHISSFYTNLLNSVKDLKNKNRFEIKIIPYSIGSIQLRYLYEADSEKNSYIHDFPDLLYKEICDTCDSRKYWFQRFT